MSGKCQTVDNFNKNVQNYIIGTVRVQVTINILKKIIIFFIDKMHRLALRFYERLKFLF